MTYLNPLGILKPAWEKDDASCPACGSAFRNQPAKILSIQGNVIDCGHRWHDQQEEQHEHHE